MCYVSLNLKSAPSKSAKRQSRRRGSGDKRPSETMTGPVGARLDQAIEILKAMHAKVSGPGECFVDFFDEVALELADRVKGKRFPGYELLWAGYAVGVVQTVASALQTSEGDILMMAAAGQKELLQERDLASAVSDREFGHLRNRSGPQADAVSEDE